MPADEVLGAGLLGLGMAFCVLGVYGLLHLPDVYCRPHATGVVITLGAGAVLPSLLVLAPQRAGLKALSTAVFLLLTAPMVTHALARVAHRHAAELTADSICDELASDRRTGELPRGEADG